MEMCHPDATRHCHAHPNIGAGGHHYSKAGTDPHDSLLSSCSVLLGQEPGTVQAEDSDEDSAGLVISSSKLLGVPMGRKWWLWG